MAQWVNSRIQDVTVSKMCSFSIEDILDIFAVDQEFASKKRKGCGLQVMQI